MGGTASKPETVKPQQVSQLPNGTKKEEDYNAPLANKALPKDLQGLVDQEEENFWDQVSQGRGPESTDSSLRYAAYANRVRTILLSAHRYVAYTSDIGESFRPIAHPYLVKGAYGVSWAYLIGDVAHEGYKAYLRQEQILHPASPAISENGPTKATGSNFGDPVQKLKDAGKEVQHAVVAPPGSGTVPAIEDYRAVMAQRAVFQSIASMGLPAFTIHSIVRYSGQALKGAKSPRIRTWGPIGLGLAAVPFLPYMFDKPVEEAVEFAFHKAFQTFGGPEAVGHTSPTGREEKLNKENAKQKLKEL